MNLLAVPEYPKDDCRSKDDCRLYEFSLPRGFHRALLADRDFMLLAVRKNCHVLGDAEETIRSDRTVVSVAVAQDGRSLQFASSTLRSDPEVCCAAVANTPSSIMFTLSVPDREPPNLHPSVALAYAYSHHPGIKSMCAHMFSMYLEGLCSDVNVVLDDGTVLAAHRAVLASRSLVLKAQFTNGMLETRTADLHMHGCSRVAADSFLRFLYSGMLDEEIINSRDADLVAELSSLAEYYDVPDLPDFPSGF